MEYSHWKELHRQLWKVVEEYEEQRAALKVECNNPKCKTGTTLQIGYVFRPLPKCYCSLYFLTPRSHQTWTDDGNDSGYLQDKGGRFEDLMACGEMLVVSVTLRDLTGSSSQSVLTQNSSNSHQQARVTNKLMKALGSKVVPTISDYFKAPEDNESFASVPSSKRVLSSGPKEGVCSHSVKTSDRFHKKNESSKVSESVDGSWCHTTINAPTPLCLTEGDQNPQGKRIRKNHDELHDNRVKVKKTLVPKKTTRALTNLKQTSLLDFKKNPCTDLSNSASEQRNVFVLAEGNVADKKVHVHGNFNKNCKTSKGEKTKENFGRPSWKKSFFSVSSSDSESDGNNEVRFSEGDTSRDFFLESPKENVECEAQNMNMLSCSEEFVSAEKNKLNNVFFIGDVSQRKEADDVGGSVSPQTDPLGSLALVDVAGNVKENTVRNVDDYEQYKLMDALSFLVSRGSSQNATKPLSCNYTSPNVALQKNPDTDPCFSGFCKAETDAEDESFYENDMEYKQNYTRKKRERCSSGLRYTAGNIQCASDGKNDLFLFRVTKQEHVELDHNSHDYLHSSKENEHDVLNRMQQNQDGGMCSSCEEHSRNEESHEDYRIFDAARRKVHSPYQDKTTTKMPKISSQKRLLSLVSSHEKSVHIKTEVDDTADLLTLSNCADIQSNRLGEEPSRVSVCDEYANCEVNLEKTCLSKVTVKSVKSCRQITCQTCDEEHSDLEAPVPGCQNTSQPGKKHSKEKVKLRNHRNVNLKTSPDVKYFSTDIKYPSQTEESLHSAGGNTMEGNEQIYPTQNVFLHAEEQRQKLQSNRVASSVEYVPSSMEYLSETKKSSYSSKDSMVTVNEEAYCAQMYENESFFSSEERIEHTAGRQMAGYQNSLSHGLDGKDTFEAWCRSRDVNSSPQLLSNELLLENSCEESLFVNVETSSSNDCESPRQMCNESPVMREEPSQHSVFHDTHKDPLCTSPQKDSEKKSLVEILRNLKYLHNRRKEYHVGLTSESEVSKQFFTDSPAAHDTALYFSSRSDTEDNLEQENHWSESRTGCSIPQRHQTHTKKQKDAHKTLCDKVKDANKIGKKKKEQSNISSFLNRNKRVCSIGLCDTSNQGAQAKNIMGQFSQDDRCEAGLDASNEEYVPEEVCTDGMKKVNWESSSSDAPTSSIYPFEANEQLLLSKNSKILARDSDESGHSVDQMEENCVESSTRYTGSVSSETNHVSDCVSPEDLNLNSLEDEQEGNLRRSTRIKRRSHVMELFPDCNSESECHSKDGNSSPHAKKLKQNENKLKYKQNKGVLKQKKIEKFFKVKTPVKKSKVAVQSKNPCKKNKCDRDENGSEDDTSRAHLPVKKKKDQHSYKTQKEVSKPSTSKASCSKATETSKTQGGQDKTDMSYYNELWNFSLGEKNDKEDKQTNNTKKQKNKKSSVKKCQKEKQKKKDAKQKQSKSDTKEPTSEPIDDDFYLKIQAEVEQLNAIASRDVDDVPMVDGMRNGKSCEEECQITDVVEGTKRSLDSLRKSYKKLRNMTDSDLEQRMEENLSYLENVIRGVLPNERHQWFKESDPELTLQQDYLIYGPFSSDQSLFVLELLKKKLSHMDKLIGNSFDVPVYRCRVLVPIFFTKIVMDNENVSLDEAYSLLAKFSLNKNITEDLEHSESRKF
ncbi:uncharacterized protein LOC123506528 isoform X2 [Portunus trituberculatus]|nr:uncharacterized protein LOC123506528 isoform X2 [Portunus trituberculatus]